MAPRFKPKIRVIITRMLLGLFDKHVSLRKKFLPSFLSQKFAPQWFLFIKQLEKHPGDDSDNAFLFEAVVLVPFQLY